MGEPLGRAVVGFYWTLPVPRVGFTALPADVDAAARVSDTIRYQRDVIRRRVRQDGGRLIHESVFLEVHPDRGAETIRPDLEKAAAICRSKDAVLMLVDFAKIRGWRSHAPLKQWLKGAGVDCCPLPPDPLIGDPMIGGWSFDPAAHFDAWRERTSQWRREKPDRANLAAERALQLREAGLSFPKTAEALNAEGFRTRSGKAWTGENVRKLLLQTTSR